MRDVGHRLEGLQRHVGAVVLEHQADGEQRCDGEEEGGGQGEADGGAPADDAVARALDEEPHGIDDEAGEGDDLEHGDGDGEGVFLFAAALPGLGQFPEAARRSDAVAGDVDLHAPASLVHVARVAGAGFPFQRVVAARLLHFGGRLLEVHGGGVPSQRGGELGGDFAGAFGRDVGAGTGLRDGVAEAGEAIRNEVSR